MKLLAFFLIFVRAVICLETPTISLPSLSVSVNINDTAKLPCVVKNRQNTTILWSKVSENVTGSMSPVPLAVNEGMLLADSRLSSHFENPDTLVLEIKNVQRNDAGSYRCAVIVNPNLQEAKDIALQVRVAPTILENTTTSLTKVENSTDTKLECYVQNAYPTPTIEWTRENNGLLPDGKTTYQGNVLRFHRLRKEDAGTYYCNANNDVGPAVRKTFYLSVEFKPEIQVAKKRVGQALNFKAELECKVTAYPAPEISWMKNFTQVPENTQLYSVETSADGVTTTSKLSITPAERSQYGQYTCKAGNKLGEAKETIDFYETADLQCAPTCGSSLEYPNFKMIASTALLLVFVFRW